MTRLLWRPICWLGTTGGAGSWRRSKLQGSSMALAPEAGWKDPLVDGLRNVCSRRRQQVPEGSWSLDLLVGRGLSSSRSADCTRTGFSRLLFKRSRNKWSAVLFEGGRRLGVTAQECMGDYE